MCKFFLTFKNINPKNLTYVTAWKRTKYLFQSSLLYTGLKHLVQIYFVLYHDVES